MGRAYAVTFEHDGRAYNVWFWPHEPDLDPDAPPPAEVNVRDGSLTAGRWMPIDLDGGTVNVEVQD